MLQKNYHVYNVKQLIDMIENGTLIIDNSYQRRKVWVDRDKVRLIETILMGYLIPSLYFWNAQVDPDTGNTITHIVDGQQRITALVDFLEGDFKLNKSFLTNQDLSLEYENKNFNELDSSFKLRIWGYELPVVQLSNINDKDEIKNIFYRLNLTDYNLNEQEKRHSNTSGLFADLAIDIAEDDFWADNNFFNSKDLRRMGDIQFCATLLLLARSGISNQATQKVLNDAYDDFKDDYPDRENDRERIQKWMVIVSKFTNDITVGFLQKKTQLYTVFCLADFMERREIDINENHIKQFSKYVEAYSNFSNNQDKDGVLYNLLNMHKLASSEGIHKQKNRTIRFEVLKKIIIDHEYIFD